MFESSPKNSKNLVEVIHFSSGGILNTSNLELHFCTYSAKIEHGKS